MQKHMATYLRCGIRLHSCGSESTEYDRGSDDNDDFGGGAGEDEGYEKNARLPGLPSLVLP